MTSTMKPTHYAISDALKMHPDMPEVKAARKALSGFKKERRLPDYYPTRAAAESAIASHYKDCPVPVEVSERFSVNVGF